MGNGSNPFLLVVETSIKTMNVHTIVLHEKHDVGFVIIKEKKLCGDALELRGRQSLKKHKPLKRKYM